MCEGWWTEARNADERSGMHARGTKQHELVEDTPRELPWRRPDLQRRVNVHIQAEMNRSEGRRRIMGGDLNAATSRTGYSISKKSHFEKEDNQFQEFVQRTGGSLIQSERHTRKDLMGGASLDDIKRATLDHIITWIFSMMIRPKCRRRRVQCIG